jgi:hypothetical protein
MTELYCFRKKIAAAAAQGSLRVSAYKHKSVVSRAEENEDTCDVDSAKEKSVGTFAASRDNKTFDLYPISYYCTSVSQQ